MPGKQNVPTSLKKYVESDITPRGLRIKKRCNFLDPDLEREWHLLAEFCSKKTKAGYHKSKGKEVTTNA